MKTWRMKAKETKVKSKKKWAGVAPHRKEAKIKWDQFTVNKKKWQEVRKITINDFIRQISN